MSETATIPATPVANPQRIRVGQAALSAAIRSSRKDADTDVILQRATAFRGFLAESPSEPEAGVQEPTARERVSYSDLIDLVGQAVADLTASGQSVSRDNVGAWLRSNGRAVGNERLGRFMRANEFIWI